MPTADRYRLSPPGQPLTSAEFFNALFADVPASNSKSYVLTSWRCWNPECSVEDLRIRASGGVRQERLVCPFCRSPLEFLGNRKLITLVPVDPAP